MWLPSPVVRRYPSQAGHRRKYAGKRVGVEPSLCHALVTLGFTGRKSTQELACKNILNFPLYGTEGNGIISGVGFRY